MWGCSRRFLSALRRGSLILPSRACHSLRASGTNLRRYMVFPLSTSDSVNVYLDAPIFLCKPMPDKLCQLPVSKGFNQHLEDLRCYHIKCRSVMVKDRHRLFSGDAEYLRRIFLEFRHTNRKIGVNGVHVYNCPLCSALNIELFTELFKPLFILESHHL